MFNEVSAKGLAKVGNSGKPDKARAIQKATGCSQLAIGIEARKAKTVAQYAWAVADREADKDNQNA